MRNTEFCPETSKVQELFEGVKIHSQIGSGGYKIVYRAEHPTHGEVALKLVKPGGSRDRERALREISAAAKLSGPEFATIHCFGQKEVDSTTILYVFEEFLKGPNLRQLLCESRKLTAPETLRIGLALLATLVKVSEADIVHRDIKPENIFILPDDRVVLIDFGIARHLNLASITQDDALVGPLTPGYAAPEQIRNEKRKINVRTDIFLIGIVMYECLVGYNPFTKDCSGPREFLNRNLGFDPTPLSSLGFPKNLSDFVNTCLQKHPSRRYPNATEALRVLETISER